MGIAIRLYPEVLRSLAFGSVSGTYAGVGTPLDHPSIIFLLQNILDTDILVSFDGVNDHWYLPSGGFLLLDNTSNKTIDSGLYMSQGQRVYVKEAGSGPTSGTVYLSTFYGAS